MTTQSDGSASALPDRYLSETVLRACDILRAFHFGDEILRLKDLVVRTGLNKSTALRLLHSLDEGGLIERVPKSQYRIKIKPISRRRIRLGYAGQSAQSAFSKEVTQSIVQHADLEGVELLLLDNHGSPRNALENADKLINARVDLVIEHQRHAHSAPTISRKFQEAGIPVIAVSYPHPGAIYYGANSYRTALTAGRALGRWAARNFQRKVDEVVLLDCPTAGDLSKAWLRGVEKGLHEVLPNQQQTRVIHLDGKGEFAPSFEAIRKYLRFSFSERILVAAINDESALGALSSFNLAGRLKHCGIISCGASQIARTELRNPGTRLIASVGNFPERFGRDLVLMALKVLDKKPVAPVTFIEDRLITSSNVDLYYPLDTIATPIAPPLSRNTLEANC